MQLTDNTTKKQKRTTSDSVVLPRPIPKEETDAITVRIKEIRGELSRAEFGERAGLAESTLRSYENGVSVPHDVVACLAFAGGVTADWLITGRGQKQRRGFASQSLSMGNSAGLLAMQYIKGSNDCAPSAIINSDLLRMCHQACCHVHGEDFPKALVTIQLVYAADFYNQLAALANSKGPQATVDDFCRLDAKALSDQLRFFLQMGWARKFPFESDLAGTW